MTSNSPENPLTPEELELRRRKVRKIVLIRAGLLGALVAAWWIFFVPDALVGPEMRSPMGIAAGVIAMGAYLYFLRESLFGRK